VDADKLARALADRFQRIVPEGFYVREADGVLWYAADAPVYDGGKTGNYVVDTLDNGGDAAEEQVASCAWFALSELQDYADETSTKPWPGERTTPVPLPGAAVIERKLYLWFGDADAPVLECEPIDLASLD